jgi:hypothetical protein
LGNRLTKTLSENGMDAEWAAPLGYGLEGQWRFEVLDLDGRRIDKVLASRREA